MFDERERVARPSILLPHTTLSNWVRGMLVMLFISNTGTALQLATQAWFIWETTHRPAMLGLLGLVQATPLLGVPLLGGMLADRWPRRFILLVTQSTLAVVAALMGILALSGSLTLVLVLALAGLLAIVMALDNPVRQVYLPGVVPSEHRSQTIGLNALTYNAGAVVGPALAGVLLLHTSVGWCFLLNALSYTVVVGWLILGPAGRPVRERAIQSQPGESIFSYVKHSAQIVSLLLLVAMVSLLGRSYPTILPILVNGSGKGSASAYGNLAALPGIGAMGAAVLVAWSLRRWRYVRHWWLGSILLGMMIACVGGTTNLYVVGMALLVVGCAATATMTLLNAELQHTTPDDMRGRVMSLYTWLAAGMPALGGWLLGTLMSVIAPRLVLIIAGITLAGVTLLLRMRLEQTGHG